MEAFVLIQTDDQTTRVAGELLGLAGVVAAEDLRGPYDAIARLRTGTSPGRMEESIEKIRAIPGVDRAIAARLLNPSDNISADEAA